MAQVWRETHVVHDNLSDSKAVHAHTAARVVYTILGVINGILALRFALMLLGANSSNAFAQIIYNLCHARSLPHFSDSLITMSNTVHHASSLKL